MRPQSRDCLAPALVFLIGLSAQGCAPSFQDARLVGPGRAEITPNFSAAGVSGEGGSEHVANNFGAHVMVGLHDRLDLGAGFARVQFVDGGEGGNLIAFGPKVGLVRDRVAFALPVGFAVGEDVNVSETITLQPTMIFTVPLGTRVDFSPSAKLVLPTCDDCETLVGFNFGFGIKTTDQRLTVRPEIAFLRNPGQSGTVWSVGVGASIRTK